jgi:hypothetical protein
MKGIDSGKASYEWLGKHKSMRRSREKELEGGPPSTSCPKVEAVL